ncbi:SGNH/GDSL hydrolase family protein [Bradyrhizobium lupini]|uniref:SGNH/GDSL hydrolase family protein n=1 Tax=Rhizobium lupini TaxID=136996 RepID=UPI0034C66F1A
MARLWFPGGGGSAATRFNPNTIVALGDSRVAQIHADSIFYNKNAQNHFTVGNALAGNRAILVANFGKSGDRTDQVLARLAAALATGAKFLYIHAGCNDIGQLYPTATTSGSTAWANIKTMIDAAVAIGMQVIYVLDPGATNFNTSMMVQLLTLNESAREYAERCPGLHLLDLPAALYDPANASTTTVPLITSLDGTHENLASSYLGGKLWASLLTSIMPPRPHGFHASFETPGLSTMNLLANPMFATTTGGTVGTGMSGTVAGSWTVSHGGSAVVNASVGTASDGSGLKEQVMATTFSAALDEGRLQQDVVLTNWSPGDKIQGSAEIVVDAGSTNLAGVCLYVQANGVLNGTQTAVTTMDNYCMTAGWGAMTSEGYKMLLQTEVMTIPAYQTKSWVTAHIKVVGAGAGSATARVRRFGLRKRLS